MQVNVDADDIRGRSSPGVSGRMSSAQALSRILTGTSLTWEVENGFVTLRPAPQTAQDSQGSINLGALRVEGQGSGSGGIGRDGSTGTGGAAGGADEIFAAPRAVSTVTRGDTDRTPARPAPYPPADVPGVTTPVNRPHPRQPVTI